MVEIVADPQLVAYCGLSCGACPALLKGKCPGCRETTKGSWCKVRTCCLTAAYASCAQCTEHDDPITCRRYTNLFSRLVGFVLRSDRRASLLQLREIGPEAHARCMASAGRPAFKR